MADQTQAKQMHTETTSSISATNYTPSDLLELCFILLGCITRRDSSNALKTLQSLHACLSSAKCSAAIPTNQILLPLSTCLRFFPGQKQSEWTLRCLVAGSQAGYYVPKDSILDFTQQILQRLPDTTQVKINLQPTDSMNDSSMEELWSLAIQAFICCIESAKREQYPLYPDRWVSILGYATSALLDLAKSHGLGRSLRIDALNGIKIVFEYLSSDLERISFFLPGICSSLTKILLADEKQGKIIISTSFELMQRVIVKTLSDSSIPEQSLRHDTPSNAADALKKIVSNSIAHSSKETNDKDATPNAGRQEEKQSNFREVRTKKWFEMSCFQITSIIKSLMEKYRNLVIPKLVESLCGFCIEILQNCRQSLKDAIPELTDFLLAHIDDPCEMVSGMCQKYIHEFSHRTDPGDELATDHFQETLRQSLVKSYISLPRIVQNQNEDDLKYNLKLACGYTIMCHQSFPRILSIYGAKLIHPVMMLLQIEKVPSKVLEYTDMNVPFMNKQQVEDDYSNLVNPQFDARDISSLLASRIQPLSFRKNFLFHREDSTRRLVLKLARYLGLFSNVDDLVSLLLGSISDRELGNTTHTQTLLLLNELILGACGAILCDLNDTSSLLRFDYPLTSERLAQLSNAIEIYLDYLVRLISPEELDSAESVYAPFVAYEKCIMYCAALEGIRNIACVLGDDIQVHFPRLLFPLFGCVGSSNSIISGVALEVTTIVSRVSRYSNVSQLISANADYLVDSLCQELKYYPLFPQVTQILYAITHHSGSAIIPYVEEVLDSVFNILPDLQQDDAMIFQLLRVLREIIRSCSLQVTHTHPAKEEKSNFKADVQGDEEANGISAEEFFKKRAEMHSDETDNPSKEDDEVPIPPNVQIVLDIVREVNHFSNVNQQDTRLLCNEILRIGLSTLLESDSKGLGLLNSYWKGLMGGFRYEGKVVSRSLFSVIQEISRLRPNFVKGRYQEDLHPALMALLERESVRMETDYDFTSIERNPAMQNAVGAIKTIQILFEHNCIPVYLLDRPIHLVLPFISALKPKPLREAAVNCLSLVPEDAADGLFVKLARYSHPNLESPHPFFPRPSFGRVDPQEVVLFSESAALIMHHMQAHFS